MTTITTQDVSNWMREQLAKAHELSNYGSITVTVSQFKDSIAGQPSVRYRIYLGDEYGDAVESGGIEGCFAVLAKVTPQSRAEKLRADAAELLKQAEELDAFTA